MENQEFTQQSNICIDFKVGPPPRMLACSSASIVWIFINSFIHLLSHVYISESCFYFSILHSSKHKNLFKATSIKTIPAADT